MPNILKYSKLIICADDTHSIFSRTYFDILHIYPTNIQDDLLCLTSWLFSNKLKLNVKKNQSYTL